MNSKANNTTRERGSDLLSTAEFGKLVGRQPRTIRKWIEEGFIPREYVQEVRGVYRIKRIAQHALGES